MVIEAFKNCYILNIYNIEGKLISKIKKVEILLKYITRLIKTPNNSIFQTNNELKKSGKG